MNILQTVKYYEPSKGGMESVVKNIVEGVSSIDSTKFFTVYSNNHFPSYKKNENEIPQIRVIKELTPILFKSQPLSLLYRNLRPLITSNDVIHHHYPFPNMEIALLRNKDLFLNKKLIVTWHANIKNSRWSFIKSFYNPIIEKILNVASDIIVTSPQLFESSDILGRYEKKVKVIPLSFDPSFEVNNEPRLFDESKNKKVLFVGKLRKYKGLSFLIDAIVSLDVQLIIVGDGEEEESLKKQVINLNLESRVTFFKNVDDKQLLRIYQDVDLFVLPSINEAEAFGVVQLEAMSSGLPVINTSLNSGVPFVSLNGVSGITVNPMDSTQLRDGIADILGNKEKYEAYSLNSLKRVKLFSRKMLSESYLSIYNK